MNATIGPDPEPEDGSATSRDPISELLNLLNVLGLLGPLSSLSTVAAPMAQALRQINLEQFAGWKADAEHLLGTFTRLQQSLEQLQHTADALNDQLAQILQTLSEQQQSDSC
jgi:hypothetical protein